MRRLILIVVALAGVAAGGANSALAQRRTAPRDDTEDKLPPSVPPPISTLAPTRGIQGPRLEPGAVLCRTETDLVHRAEVNRRRTENIQDPGNPLENCHIISQLRAVDVVEKRGLGRTEVKLKPTGETGWTDAYLR